MPTIPSGHKPCSDPLKVREFSQAVAYALVERVVFGMEAELLKVRARYVSRNSGTRLSLRYPGKSGHECANVYPSMLRLVRLGLFFRDR